MQILKVTWDIFQEPDSRQKYLNDLIGNVLSAFGLNIQSLDRGHSVFHL